MTQQEFFNVQQGDGVFTTLVVECKLPCWKSLLSTRGISASIVLPLVLPRLAAAAASVAAAMPAHSGDRGGQGNAPFESALLQLIVWTRCRLSDNDTTKIHMTRDVWPPANTRLYCTKHIVQH